MTGERVLVTGATGFIGSHLVERLLEQGLAVRCLVRSNKPLPAGAEAVKGDLLTGEGLERSLEGVGLVYHLAGVTKPLTVSGYDDGNVRATETLLLACEQAGIGRLIHVSSLAAAGPSPDGSPLTEEDTPGPVSHYGRSKLRGEGAVRGSPLASRTVIVRPPVVYGPRDTDVLQVFRAAAKGLIFTIGRQESYFSFVYVSDLVDGLLRAAAAESAGGKTYFLASLLPVTWAEFGRIAASAAGAQASRIPVPVWAAQAAGAVAERLARLTGKPGILSRDKIREARHRFWTCSPALAMHDLGFRARTSLQDGIAATYAWYKDAGWLN